MSPSIAASARIRAADDVKSLRHGLSALQLAGAPRGVSSGELATACRISRAAAYRTLQTLVDEGYLSRSGAGNRVRYQLCSRVRELSDGYDGGVLVLEVAIPLALEWTRQHGWPLAISTPDGGHCVVRFTTDPTAGRALMRYRAGARMCALMSASAMLSLAYQPAEIQAEALRSLPNTPLPPYAPRRTAEEITVILARVRRDGHAVFRPLGLREATVAIPVWFNKTISACIALRYMLVADRGSVGHVERLSLLRGLSELITRESFRRADLRPDTPTR